MDRGIFLGLQWGHLSFWAVTWNTWSNLNGSSQSVCHKLPFGPRRIYMLINHAVMTKGAFYEVDTAFDAKANEIIVKNVCLTEWAEILQFLCCSSFRFFPQIHFICLGLILLLQIEVFTVLILWIKTYVLLLQMRSTTKINALRLHFSKNVH